MFQVNEISKTDTNDGINLVLPISINGRKIDGIVDTGTQITVVNEDCFKNVKLPVGCAQVFPLKGQGTILVSRLYQGTQPVSTLGT
jgi:hypothetical protein